MNKNRIYYVILIVVMCTLVIMGGFIYRTMKSIELSEKEQLIKEEEVALINDYFKDHTDYYIEKIPDGYSFPLDEDSLLPYPEYYVKGFNKVMVCYVFSSKEKAIDAMNELKNNGGEGFILVSRTIFYAKTEDEQYNKVIMEAQEFFE